MNCEYLGVGQVIVAGVSGGVAFFVLRTVEAFLIAYFGWGKK